MMGRLKLLEKGTGVPRGDRSIASALLGVNGDGGVTQGCR